MERALGVQWALESDMFSFRIVIKDQPLTRRGILSSISSVYDPPPPSPPGYSRALSVSRQEDFAGFVPNEARLGRRDLRKVRRTLGKVERPVACT